MGAGGTGGDVRRADGGFREAGETDESYPKEGKTMFKCFVMVAVVLVGSFLGCNSDSGSFQGHKLGESFAQFNGVEHSQVQTPPSISYTGTVHCFVTQTLGDQCKGPRNDFDNAHFTFVDDKLTSIETVGAGGIIGNSHQNWNWNLYLSDLRKQYGKPDKMTVNDVLWLRHRYVVHAYLTVAPMPFTRTGEEVQTENIEVLDRSVYDQSRTRGGTP